MQKPGEVRLALKLCGDPPKPCQRLQIWDEVSDSPVCTVINGDWGDEWPALRKFGSDAPSQIYSPREPVALKAGEYQIYMERNVYGSVPKEIAEKQAQLIVRAVNSHSDLLAACERAVAAINSGEGVDVEYRFAKELAAAYQQLKAAIAKAKARQ